MTQEAHHLAVSRCAGQGHVAVPECSVDLEMEAWLGYGVTRTPWLLENVHPVGRKVKVQTVSLDLRSGHLSSDEEEEERREK